MTTASGKTNRLASETSTYLLQHASNPVDWYAWGEEAFAASQQANKPILLSIGYAACHWCHVMAHESFEDPETAELMNRYFINIKVDREERPDVDKIYMDALHHMGEQGGWPLTMFLDTELKPFWGGTYFPPTSKYGRPSFSHVLTQIHHIWSNQHDKIRTNTTAILQRLSAPAGGTTDAQVHDGLLESAMSQILSAMDWQHGGIGMAPKFPQSPLFQLLWTMARTTGHTKAREAVIATMTHICQGGIYDHLGGGIARYAVDQRWLVPHFEKMLYDNAQFVSQLGDILATIENQLFHQRIEKTCQWLIDEMTTPDGLFAASYDADSEGEEGKYYCWSKTEVDQIVSESSRYLFQATYDVTETGNWEHQNILNRLNSMNLLSDDEEAQLKAARQQLLEARKGRIPPGWDDKALTDWNALTVQALLKASVILERPDLQSRAVSTLNALQNCLTSDATLHHSYRRNSLRGHATADDYAHLIAACIDTYEHTLDPAWIEQAQVHAEVMISGYLADDGTGFHMSPAAATDLIVRQVYRTDDVTPNANSTMAINLWKLSVLSNQPAYHNLADKIIAASTRQMTNNPFACPSAWTAWIALSRQSLIVLCGDNDHDAYKALHRTALRHRDPITLVMHAEPGMFPEEHPAYGKGGEREPTAYYCKNQACSLPITDALELRDAL